MAHAHLRLLNDTNAKSFAGGFAEAEERDSISGHS
jgi:hypothetical protein